MAKTRTKRTPVRDIPGFAVIIRAVHERGPAQSEALAELDRRGLWLSPEQRIMAGIVPAPALGRFADFLADRLGTRGWVVAARPEAEFCGPKCRADWNSRRAQRGAELYDLAMHMRFPFGPKPSVAALTLLCRAVSKFREEDVQRRAGRRSWAHPSTVLARRPYLAAVTMSRRRVRS